TMCLLVDWVVGWFWGSGTPFVPPDRRREHGAHGVRNRFTPFPSGAATGGAAITEGINDDAATSPTRLCSPVSHGRRAGDHAHVPRWRRPAGVRRLPVARQRRRPHRARALLRPVPRPGRPARRRVRARHA